MNEKNEKLAVIYCRVSTKEQVDEGGSLATQEKICRDYALKNGYEVVQIFVERGESAKNADRTELKKLLAYCTSKKQNIKAVIAYKIDRVARNIDDYRQIRLLLKRYNVEIKSTSEYFEDNPAGRFMENIIANVAQFDNDVRTERSINGSRDAMRGGRYVWVAPYGYSNVQADGKSTIAPNDKADIIRKAFLEVAKDQYPVDVIRQRLFSEGLTARNGKSMTKSHYYKLLNNEIYSGWIIKFGERHLGAFEPIITNELFEQVQRILKRRSHQSSVYRRENPDFPLRRFVYHSTGKKLTGCWAQGRDRKYAHYRFMGICDKTKMDKETIEEAYMAFVNQYTLSHEHIVHFKKALKNALDSAIEKDVIEAKRLQATIDELNKKQTNLINKNDKGIISDTILRRQLDQIEGDLIKANAALYSLPDIKEDIGVLLDFAAGYLENPGAVWQKASFQQKLELQWFVFPEGVEFGKGIFRTKEVASIFKVKDIFLPSLSSSVPIKRLNYEHTTYTKSLTQSIPLETWRQFAKELHRLVTILKGPPP
jgi:site-specific DNA recombinase